MYDGEHVNRAEESLRRKRYRLLRQLDVDPRPSGLTVFRAAAKQKNEASL
jgi:hypothetical protein